MVSGQEFPLALPHALPFFISAVIPPQDVKNTVRDEQGHFVVICTRVKRGLASSDRWTDHDIPEKKRKVSTINGTAIGPFGATRWSGYHLDDFSTVDRKRENIGRTSFAHVLTIEFGHVGLVHEEDAQFGSTAHTFGPEHGDGKPLPTPDVDGHLPLLIGTEHFRVGVATHLGSTREAWRTRVHERSPGADWGERS